MKVAIQKKHIKVSIEKDSKWDVVIDDNLDHEIKCDESMWSLEPGKEIEVFFNKLVFLMN